MRKGAKRGRCSIGTRIFRVYVHGIDGANGGSDNIIDVWTIRRDGGFSSLSGFEKHIGRVFEEKLKRLHGHGLMDGASVMMEMEAV